MNGGGTYSRIFSAIFIVLWLAVIFIPLILLYVSAAGGDCQQVQDGSHYWSLTIENFLRAFIIGAVSIVLGYCPARLLAGSGKFRTILFVLIMLPLILPSYVLYYAWTLPFSPGTWMGDYLARHPQAVKLFFSFLSSGVMVLWFWPLAALIIAQGRRNIGRSILESASLEAGGRQIFRHITFPLLAGPMLLAFAVCFVMALSEFTTFHLAGMRTIGTELAVVYELTGSEGCVARYSLPVAIIAVIIAAMFVRKMRRWDSARAESGQNKSEFSFWQWFVTVLLLTVSLVVPVFLFVSNIAEWKVFTEFFKLHFDDLDWSVRTSAAAAVLAYFMAWGASSLDRFCRAGRYLSYFVYTTIFVVMLVPGSLAAAIILKMMAALELPSAVRQSWLIVSAGLAARFCAVGLIVIALMRLSEIKGLTEAARIDGATSWQIFRYIHLPRTWRVFAGVFVLIFMLCMTELSVTMVLLPAGVPNFAQRLLNQMHYARDQQVIASCVILICVFLAAMLVFVLLMRAASVRRYVLPVILTILSICLVGCRKSYANSSEPKVLMIIGRTGPGPGEFLYPRAIDIAPDGSIFVADKTGRIHRYSAEGKFLSSFKMPEYELGKPTGISFGPDGNLYAADTHYSRIMVFTPEGKIVRQFGQYGEEEGCFIYPTDAAFAPDGRIFVSEYGGNDRISVFDEGGKFLYSFGSPGNGRGELSRPSALCIDKTRKILYVADACNHRIAIYDYDGRLVDYIGTLGTGLGQLRYPYGLALMEDGNLAVSEFGNNRIQLFSPDGKSLGVYGSAGRRQGELACPWGLAVERSGRAFIVDALNNRIQVWQLL